MHQNGMNGVRSFFLYFFNNYFEGYLLTMNKVSDILW